MELSQVSKGALRHKVTVVETTLIGQTMHITSSGWVQSFRICSFITKVLTMYLQDIVPNGLQEEDEGWSLSAIIQGQQSLIQGGIFQEFYRTHRKKLEEEATLTLIKLSPWTLPRAWQCKRELISPSFFLALETKGHKDEHWRKCGRQRITSCLRKQAIWQLHLEPLQEV